MNDIKDKKEWEKKLENAVGLKNPSMSSDEDCCSSEDENSAVSPKIKSEGNIIVDEKCDEGSQQNEEESSSRTKTIPVTPELLAASKVKYQKRFRKFRKRVENIKSIALLLCASDIYNQLSTDDKIKHDLFLADMLCGLYWMFVRTYGKDPTAHEIFPEITRIKELSDRFDSIVAKRTAPHVDKGAAKRMVKHALWDLEEKNKEMKENSEEASDSANKSPALGKRGRNFQSKTKQNTHIRFDEAVEEGTSSSNQFQKHKRKRLCK